MQQTRAGIFEFHVSRAAREEYDFDLELFSSSGNVVFANFAAARGFAAKLNAKNPSRGVRAGDVNAMGLIDEVMHALVEEYRLRHNPKLWLEALALLEGNIGHERVNTALLEFGKSFPPLAVFTGAIKLEASEGNDVHVWTHRHRRYLTATLVKPNVIPKRVYSEPRSRVCAVAHRQRI